MSIVCISGLRGSLKIPQHDIPLLIPFGNSPLLSGIVLGRSVFERVEQSGQLVGFKSHPRHQSPTGFSMKRFVFEFLCFPAVMWIRLIAFVLGYEILIGQGQFVNSNELTDKSEEKSEEEE